MTVPLSRRAQRQVAELTAHYERLGRDQALRNLELAIIAAQTHIRRGTGDVVSAPRPYPELSALRLSWLYIRRYWIAFLTEAPEPTITAVLYDQADIPTRLGVSRP